MPAEQMLDLVERGCSHPHEQGAGQRSRSAVVHVKLLPANSLHFARRGRCASSRPVQAVDLETCKDRARMAGRLRKRRLGYMAASQK